jgi:hypothetical protein
LQHTVLETRTYFLNRKQKFQVEPEVIPGLAVNQTKLKGIQLLTNIFGHCIKLLSLIIRIVI